MKDMNETINKRIYNIGDIVFFLDELSLKTGIIIGYTKECKDDDIQLICDVRCERLSYIVSEITSDKKVKPYAKTNLVEAELMSMEEAINGLKERISKYIMS